MLEEERMVKLQSDQTISEYYIQYQLKLIKMRAELANLNDCAVPFLSGAVVNLRSYFLTHAARKHG